MNSVLAQHHINDRPSRSPSSQLPPSSSPSNAINPLQHYQAQLQGLAAGQQFNTAHAPPSPSSNPSSNPNAPASHPHNHNTPVTSAALAGSSIAAQQQQLLMSKSTASRDQIALEKLRVALMLEINSEMLHEVMRMQSTITASEEQKRNPKFRECIRRIQANLVYLAAIADRSHRPASAIPQCPQILVHPPDLPALESLYNNLQQLFPGINPQNPPPPPPQSQNPSSMGPQNSMGAPPRPPTLSPKPQARPPPMQFASSGAMPPEPSPGPPNSAGLMSHSHSPPPHTPQHPPPQQPQHSPDMPPPHQGYPNNMHQQSQMAYQQQQAQHQRMEADQQRRRQQMEMMRRQQQQRQQMGMGMSMEGGVNGITGMAPPQQMGMGGMYPQQQQQMMGMGMGNQMMGMGGNMMMGSMQGQDGYGMGGGGMMGGWQGGYPQ